MCTAVSAFLQAELNSRSLSFPTLLVADTRPRVDMYSASLRVFREC